LTEIPAILAPALRIGRPLGPSPGLALYINIRLWARLCFLALDLVFLIDRVLITVADTTALAIMAAFTPASEYHVPTSWV
jgi:hypothetical protein